MITLFYFLLVCLLAVLSWITYIVVSGLFVWPPPIPTSLQTRRRMVEAIRSLRPPDASPGFILDPGCGFGSLALALARAFPRDKVVGVELQSVPLSIAKLRARLLGIHNVSFRRGDLFTVHYHDASVIACYLYGNVMEALSDKWSAELRDGCVVVSNLHPIPHWSPTQVIPVQDWLFGARAVYAYRIPDAKFHDRDISSLKSSS